VSALAGSRRLASARHRRQRSQSSPRDPRVATYAARYLPTNLSAPEIANELYVSPNTVKTHMHHLYAKLGTHRRSEAVARARALGLLAPSARRR
jgi:LuxR family maltose regulon positive regulatory protein